MTFLIVIFDDPFVRSNGFLPIKTLACLKEEKIGDFLLPKKKGMECGEKKIDSI